MAWPMAFAGEPKTTDASTPPAWPAYIAVTRSVELPALTENGQMRTAKLSQGTMVQVIKVDDDRVEVSYQGLMVLLPAAITDLSVRMKSGKQMTAAQPAAQPAILPSAQPLAQPAAQPATQPAASARQETPPDRTLPETRTFIESSMNPESFKASGLDKLSPTELRTLDKWFLDIVLASKRTAAPQQQSDPVFAAPGRKAGIIERAMLIKNFNGEKILVQRANGEKWMLRAKTWCRWAWRYEGRYICLVFSPSTSQLINDYGETYDFWTDKQIE